MAYQMLTVDSGGSQRVVTDGQIGGRTNLTVYVDALYGNDSTGLRGYKNLPFQTIVAAVTAASNGDTIHVRPGTYNEIDLIGAKTSINFHFELGAKVIYTGAGTDAIFDATGCTTLRVTGYGYFDNQVGTTGRVFLSGPSTYSVFFEAIEAHCDGEITIEAAGPSAIQEFKNK